MKQKIVELLHLKLKIPKEEIEKLIEIPPNYEMGDYAFPCFVLSRKLKKNPNEIALELAKKLKTKDFEKVESKGPYVNFFVNKKEFVKNMFAEASSENFGRGKQGEKILVEHTSVNPNASPHVGRARNSIIGDSIVRILKFRGNKVETHYYVNDVSKQIAMLALEFDPKDTFDKMLGNYMRVSKKVEQNPKLEKKVFELLEKFESGDKKVVDIFKKIVNTAVDGQKRIFSKFGIEFDYFDYESEYLGKFSKETLKKLEATGNLFEDKEGRKVIDFKDTSLVRKMRSPVFVLARSNGTGLYGLRDIAYTMEKIKHGRNIIVLGEDQKLYFEQICESLKLLNSKCPEVVHYSFVLIQDNGKAKKMATRRGEVVLLEEFLKEAYAKAKSEIDKRKTKGDAEKVAIGAIKYAMLRNDNDKNIIFSWESSLNFEGESGPYLQYSYARASSIVKKSKVKKGKLKIPEKISDSEFKLIKKIAEFPEIVSRAEKNLSPSLIANYSFSLAQIFNEFYHSSHVIGDENELFKLKLVEAFRIAMKNSLYLLGIEVMDEM